MKSNDEALEFIVQAIEKAGYRPGRDIVLALDAAASEFRDKQSYLLRAQANTRLSSADLTKYYATLTTRYPIVSIEDGLSEDDWKGWKDLTEQLGHRVQLVGDDLFVTNVEFLARGIRETHWQCHSYQTEPNRNAD